MLRAFILSLALCLLAPGIALAEISAADQQIIDSKMDIFFTKGAKGKIDEAFADFESMAMKENAAAIHARTAAGFTRAGIFLLDKDLKGFKWKLLEQRSESDLLVYRSYLLYNVGSPEVFEFVLYKHPKVGWILQSIRNTEVSTAYFHP